MLTRSKPGRTRVKQVTFPSPKRGWIQNDKLVGGITDGAEVLDNIFPTAQGGRIRKGSSKHATVGAAVIKVFTWSGGASEKMFAATADSVFEISAPADPDVAPTADLTGLSSGDWSVTQFATAGGEYIVLANGFDAVREYDGTTWTTPTITGVTSSTLTQGWPFKSRMFFIEDDSLSFWYLATNSISGAATEFPLKGVFHLGGKLLFGATWSLDSGSGIDDVCVLVTDKGEIAVYNGTDPSTASSWLLQGVYRIGVPLNKNSWFKAGGDLAILTEDGIVPLSSALKKDRAAIQADALTYPIEDVWRDAIANRTGAFSFSATLWQSQSMLVVGAPATAAGVPAAYVSNARTGAWCRYTGWDVQTSAVFGDTLYFGTAAGTVHQAETTGSDDTVAYNAVWIPRFAEGSPTTKFAKNVRFRGRAAESYNIGLGAFSDYITGEMSAPASSTSGAVNSWGTGVWGTMLWGTSADRVHVSGWSAVYANGVSLSPGIAITSNRPTAPTLDFIALDMTYEEGRVL